MLISELHHTQFDKFARIFELVIERKNSNSPAAVTRKMTTHLAYFRRRGFCGAEIVQAATSILELYGPVRGRAYIEKMRKRRRES